MTIKKLCYVVSVALATSLVHNASADSSWSGLGGDGLWANPLNWSGGVVPGNNGNLTIDPNNGSSVITIVGGETETPGISDTYGMIWGPEWGGTLNIHGTLKTSWYLAPVQWDSTHRSVINMFDNSSFSAEGIGLGYNWWWNGGPYVDLNMYGSALVGINTLFWGGHVNMYGGTMSITNGVVDGVSDQVSDQTRYINLVDGKLILPAGFTSTVNGWITRGVLFAYGKKYQSTDLVINGSDPIYPGRTVVSTIALGGSALAVHASARTNMMVGTFQQLTLLGDYPNVTNVDLSYLDPATIPAPAFQSSATNVASVTTNGRVVALSPGSATITGTFGALSSNILITVTPFTNSLIHRYSFNEASGATTADLVPGNSPAWDGALNGGATLGGGQVTLDGSSGFVQLPAGIVSNLNAVTVEAWASFGPASGWSTLFDFGNQDGLISPQGMNYIGFQPFTGATVPGAAVLFGMGDPGNANDQGTACSLVSGGVTNYLGNNVHIVAVFHPYAGYVALYTNGVLAAINNNASNPLASTLADDPLNYLGQSLYASDPFLNASIDEFRIYNGALTASQIAADHALGPNQLIGTGTNVKLSASLAAGNLIIQWPTTSALVTLLSSPALGAGAVWTPVNNPLTAAGGNYQMSIPMTGSAKFFRLSQ
jgi:hypothetical protein